MSIAITRRGKRQRRTPEEARRLILEAAQALIVTTGPEGLRLQDIAAAAGISHPLILHHFGSREGLVRAMACGNERRGMFWLLIRTCPGSRRRRSWCLPFSRP